MLWLVEVAREADLIPNLGEQAEDVLRVVGAVGVVGDAAAFVGFDAVT
ncbi:MAG: hypothetical protein OXO48_12705 [Caldilineaceae bacterium]|nr:hypothetical protein [Caldilineaceae bacterium]